MKTSTSARTAGRWRTRVTSEPEPAARVVLTWTVTNQYHREFTPEQWADAMLWFDEVDPTDLDACYNRLDRGDWKAEEFLAESAADRYWVDVDRAQLSDLT